MTDRPSPPVARYELTIKIRGNTLDEIGDELLCQTRGGFLLDSENGTRNEWHSIGGTVTSIMKHANPDMTPERYSEELDVWFAARHPKRREPK